jgi:hypothetical protein
MRGQNKPRIGGVLAPLPSRAVALVSRARELPRALAVLAV